MCNQLRSFWIILKHLARSMNSMCIKCFFSVNERPSTSNGTTSSMRYTQHTAIWQRERLQNERNERKTAIRHAPNFIEYKCTIYLDISYFFPSFFLSLFLSFRYGFAFHLLLSSDSAMVLLMPPPPQSLASIYQHMECRLVECIQFTTEW